MTPHTPQTTDHYPQAADEPWQAFFLDPELGPERTVASGLDAWTTDELLDEVLLRSAEDRPALRVTHRRTLEALLVARDRESANGRE